MSIKVALELQPCCGQRSGIGTYTYELVRRLKNGGEFEFSGTIFDFLGRNNNSAVIRAMSFPTYVNRSMPYGVYRRIWDILPLPYRRMFPDNAEITHFFNYIVPPGVTGKIINTVYDLVYLRYPETMDKRNLRRIKKGLSDSLERSAAVVTDSFFVKNEIVEELGFDSDRIHVIYPGAALIETELGASYLAEKWNIRSPYILYVGNIEPRKNLIRLIHAYNRLRAEIPGRIQMVLTGGKGWQSDDIYKAAGESRYSRDILFTGYVTSDEKAALYQNADVFIYPSVYEGFGIPVLEAMNCALPIVCSNASSLPEVVGDSAFLADPYDEQDLAEKLVQALSDKKLAGRLADSAKIRAESFSWENSADKLMALYKCIGQ